MKTSVAELMIKAKASLLKGDNESASNFLNMGIGVLGKLTLEGETRTDGVSVDRWKERFWFLLEESGLMEA
jgi:hypothetical protein